MVVLGFLFIVTVSSRYNLNQQELDITKYHLTTSSPKSYLLQEKDIVTYNEKQNSLEKTNIFLASDGKLVGYSDIVYFTNGTVSFDTDSIIYEKDLKSINCNIENISKCIKDNIVKTKSYKMDGDIKAYFLDKKFGLEIFDIVSKYKETQDKKRN
jgi:hypothetical protein